MIYIVMGPTCSGKSDVAIKISHSLNDCPIINADAFQIYKDMDIGTAKISKEDPAYKRHYLLDIKNPSETYSVKEYQNDFRKKINALLKTNNDVVVVGGTGLYIKAALYDYEFIEEQQNDNSIYDEFTNEQLYARLVALDKEASLKIHPNNRKRVIRALNILKNSDKRKSEIIAAQEHKLVFQNVMFFYINPNRETLYKNINDRVDEMFEKGLINEVKNLLQKYELSITAKQGIGYKEVIDYLSGEFSIDECIELIKRRTRNYAKRQVTFFKNQFKYEEFADKNILIERFLHEQSIWKNN